MPAAEYQEWVAYFDEYPPFDGWEATAMVCTLLAAPHSKKRPKFRDFLPAAYRRRLRRTPRQSAEQIQAVMGLHAANANAKAGAGR